MALSDILPEFQNFLHSRGLVPEKNIPFYARWVSKFLAFSERGTESDLNILLDEFVSSLKLQRALADWQVRQADEAVRLYLGPFKGGKTSPEFPGAGGPGTSLSGVPRLLDEMKRVIRMKHYSFSTERTYLDWVRRFAAYAEQRKKKEGFLELSCHQREGFCFDPESDVQCPAVFLSRGAPRRVRRYARVRRH